MDKPYYVLKEFDGSNLYLNSLELYKPVRSEHDYNNSYGVNIKQALPFRDKDKAQAIANFVDGFVWSPEEL